MFSWGVKVESSQQTLVKEESYLIFDRNENEAVRNRSAVRSMECTVVYQHKDCSADKIYFKKLSVDNNSIKQFWKLWVL